MDVKKINDILLRRNYKLFNEIDTPLAILGRIINDRLELRPVTRLPGYNPSILEFLRVSGL
jgi:hypothetical protein